MGAVPSVMMDGVMPDAPSTTHDSSSASPPSSGRRVVEGTPNNEEETQLALFASIQREYHVITTQEKLADEVVFERLKHLCLQAYVPNHGLKSQLSANNLGRRMSDPHRRKREVIFSKGLDDTSAAPNHAARSPRETKSEDCTFKLKMALKSLLFSESTESELDQQTAVMKRLEVTAGEKVITQGDVGDKFYVIEAGRLEVIVNGSEVGFLDAGAHFGELALIYDAPRAATIRAITNAVLWTLDRDEFRLINARSSSNSLAKRAKWLQKVEILSHLSQRQLSLLAGVFSCREFDEGEVIIKQGDVGDTFYIVEEGDVLCRTEDVITKVTTEVARFHAGDYFGEMALLSDCPRNATLIASNGKVKCLCLNRQEFDSMLGPLSEVLERNSRIRILKMFPLFASKTQEQLERVADEMEIRTFQNGQSIYREGEAATFFYIVKSGCIKLIQQSAARGSSSSIRGHISDDKTGSTSEEHLLKANDTFGHEVFETNKSPAASYMSSAVSCGKAQAHRLRIAGGTLVRENSTLRNIYKMNVGETGKKRFGQLTLDDVHLAGVLGEGSFGRVVMVHANVENEEHVMALKIMAKAHIIQTHQHIQVMREKNVLLSLPPHPFVVELYATYQDENYLYMLMEMVQGGELFSLLQNDEFMNSADESTVRFFAANVFMGLEHLHKNDIAYRDLKPENLLIGADGYLKIVDFGFAKKIPFTTKNNNGEEEVHTRTYTLCGTLEYLAPEFVLNTGHDLAVDYWALGILIYEILVGYSPFAAENGDTTQLFRNIAMVRMGSNAVHFPPQILECCPEACDFIRKLLQGDPTKRLGVGINGKQEIRQHPWFHDIDWDQLLAKRIDPPYVPKLSGKYDISLFEGEQGLRIEDQVFNGDNEVFQGF